MAGEKSYKLQVTVDGSVITASGVITPKQGVKGPTGPQGPKRITPPQGIYVYPESSPLSRLIIWAPGGSGYSDITIRETDEEIQFGVVGNIINLTGERGDKGPTGNPGYSGIGAIAAMIGFRLPENEFDVSSWLPHGGLVFSKDSDGNIHQIWPANSDGIVLQNYPHIDCTGPTGPAAPMPSKIEVIAAD